MPARRTLAILASCLLASTPPALAQTRPDARPRTLSTVLAEYAEPFSAIAGLRELPDGGLLVSDAREQRVVVLDAHGAVRRTLGRVGRGPAEFSQPGALYVIRGDTTLLYDRGNPRFVVIDPSLRMVAVRPVAAPSGTVFVSDDDPYAVDASGRVYVARRTSMGRPSPSLQVDSMPLVRFDPERGTTDTLLALARAPQLVSGSGNVRMSMEQPFSARDGWGVAADGRVAVVRGAPYRVEWWSGRERRAVGPAQTGRPVPVTRADRTEWERRRALAPARIGARRGTTTVSSADSPTPPFPDVKAPFVSSVALVDPSGRVWVQRLGPHGARETVYDVFDETGARVDRIAIPADLRLLSVARGAIYVARKDADDLEYIVKLRM